MLLFSMLQAAGPLEGYKWKNRLIIIACEDTTSKTYQKQLKQFARTGAEVLDRDLKILTLTKDFDESDQRFLEEKYHLNSFYTLILIGKDGGMKLCENDYVEPEKVFDLIDSMPMRKAEMRDSE